MLAQIVDEAAARFGERPVVVTPGDQLTYAELASDSSLLAGRLESLGVSPGDVVALVLPSGPEWLICAVAANRVGAAFAGISPVLSPEERSSLVGLLQPRIVVAAPHLVDGLPLRCNAIAIEDGSRGRTAQTSEDFFGAADATTPQSRNSGSESSARGPSDPAVICFTSGTTGTPKAAVFTTKQLEAIQRIDVGPEADRIWDGGSPMLASTQFAHVGMSTKLPWYFRRGVTLHVMDRWRADDALRLVAEHKMPAVGAIAPQLALMLRSPLMEKTDLSSVQMVIAGGAPSPPTLVSQVRSRFEAGYSIRYSSTESGGVGLATDAFSDDPSEWSTVGRPREGVEARIADESDREVPFGEVGELQIRSDAAMDRYWNDPVATAAALTEDRWLRTGDLARVDQIGRIVLVGRRSEMYIRGGYNVFPSEVESVLRAHPLVRDLVIVPAPDDVMGEIGVALVVGAHEGTPTLEDLRTFGSEHLASYKLPERIALIDEVPLTSAQKVDRAAARSLYG